MITDILAKEESRSIIVWKLCRWFLFI